MLLTAAQVYLLGTRQVPPELGANMVTYDPAFASQLSWPHFAPSGYPGVVHPSKVLVKSLASGYFLGIQAKKIIFKYTHDFAGYRICFTLQD